MNWILAAMRHYFREICFYFRFVHSRVHKSNLKCKQPHLSLYYGTETATRDIMAKGNHINFHFTVHDATVNETAALAHTLDECFFSVVFHLIDCMIDWLNRGLRSSLQWRWCVDRSRSVSKQRGKFVAMRLSCECHSGRRFFSCRLRGLHVNQTTQSAAVKWYIRITRGFG